VVEALAALEVGDDVETRAMPLQHVSPSVRSDAATATATVTEATEHKIWGRGVGMSRPTTCALRKVDALDGELMRGSGEE
jgi:hypothetical protein